MLPDVSRLPPKDFQADVSRFQVHFKCESRRYINPQSPQIWGRLIKEGPKLILVEPYLAGPRRKSVRRGIARADRLLA